MDAAQGRGPRRQPGRRGAAGGRGGRRRRSLRHDRSGDRRDRGPRRPPRRAASRFPRSTATSPGPSGSSLEAIDLDGNRYRREATGLKARAIQHEIDHLDGILFLDHLSLIRRQMLLARWRREHKDDTGYIKEVQAGVRPDGVMRIVFFGTPEFAVASLRALLRERFTVAGVVTQPDKPQGRSRSTLVPPSRQGRGAGSGSPRAPAGAARRRPLPRQSPAARGRSRRRGRLRAHPPAARCSTRRPAA